MLLASSTIISLLYSVTTVAAYAFPTPSPPQALAKLTSTPSLLHDFTDSNQHRSKLQERADNSDSMRKNSSPNIDHRVRTLSDILMHYRQGTTTTSNPTPVQTRDPKKGVVIEMKAVLYPKSSGSAFRPTTIDWTVSTRPTATSASKFEDISEFNSNTQLHRALVISFRGPDSIYRQRVKSTIKMKKVMDSYCRTLRIHRESIVFIYNGHMVQDDDTPDSIGMKKNLEVLTWRPAPAHLHSPLKTDDPERYTPNAPPTFRVSPGVLSRGTGYDFIDDKAAYEKDRDSDRIVLDRIKNSSFQKSAKPGFRGKPPIDKTKRPREMPNSLSNSIGIQDADSVQGFSYQDQISEKQSEEDIVGPSRATADSPSGTQSQKSDLSDSEIQEMTRLLKETGREHGLTFSEPKDH